jgi:hypothetical protein
MILTIIFSCNHKKNKLDFANKSEYKVNVGETVEIYYSTNSCCMYCQPNRYELNHVEYIGEKTVVPMKKNCDGCDATYALMYKAISPGIDTIYGQIVAASRACPDSTREMYKYIMKVE